MVAFTELDIVSKLVKFLKDKGWKIFTHIKIRGRVVDIVAIKKNEISLIEVKGSQGDIIKGVGQAVHQMGAGSFSYLAIPSSRLDEKLKETCKNLGIGLLLINSEITEIVRPKKTEALESVEKIVFKLKPKIKKTEKPKLLLQRLIPSKSRIKILTLLFTNPQKKFYLREIQRLTDENINSLRLQLKKLVKIGLVDEATRGIQKFYSLNKKFPIYEELKRIILKTQGVGNILRENLRKIGKIKFALVYGSFAKGTEIESSDVDLLVIGKVDEEKLIKVIRKAEKKIGREVNYILWSEKEFNKRAKSKNHLLVDITNNPIIGLIGDADEFRKAVEG